MKNNFSEKNTIQQLKDKIDALTKTVSKFKKSEQFLINAIASAPIGMVTLTIEGRFRTVNMAFCQITGYAEKELLTLNINQITHPDDLNIGNNVIKELTSGKAKKANFDKRYIHKNGNTIHAQVSTVILKDEFGAPQQFFTQVIDVTEHNRAEEALRKSEGQLRLITENTTDNIAITTFDLKATYIYVNPSVKSVLGYDPEDLLGKSFFDFIHPDDKKVLVPLLKKYINQKIKKLISGKEIPISETIEFRFKNKIGNWRFMQSTVNIAGKQLLAVTRDITEQKRVESKLKQNEKMLRQIIDTSPNCIFLKDRNGMYLVVNKRMAELHSKKPADFVGKYDYEIGKKWFETIDYNEFRKAEQDVIDNKKKLIIIEEPFVYQDGIERWFETTKIPFELEDNQNCLLVISTDITKRKRYEEALQESEKRLALAVEGAGFGLWDQDFSSGKVIRNKRWAQMLGYELDEIEQSKSAWRELIHPDDLATLEKMIQEHEKGGSSVFNVEHRMRTKNGEWKWIHNWGRVVERDKNGRPLRALGVHLDITDRKRAEEQIEQKSMELEKQFKRSEKQRIATLSSLSDLNKTTKKLQSEISERKNSEEELAAVNKNLEMMGETVSSMNECVSITDTTHKYIFVNNAWEKTYGYKKEEIIGKTSKIIEVEEKSDLKNEMRQQTKLGGWKGELINKKKDGTIFPTELSITPLRDVKGNIIAQIGISADITERKQTEEALLASEERYRKFFMEDLTGDYLTTREGKIIDCNPQFLKIYGFKSLEQAQKYDVTKLHKSQSEREKFKKRLEKAKFLLDLQSEQYKVNGEKIIIRENVSGEFDDDGKLINIRGYLYDITERVKAEQEVVKLTSAVEQSPVSIVITDTDGVIEYINPTFEKLTGYSSEEAIGSKPSILKSGVNPDSEYSRLWKTITAGKVWVGEFLNKKKNGELYWESATISPILDNNNSITHFLAVKEDITKKKEIVGELMEREEKYRTLTQNLNVGVYRSTPGANGRFVEVNPTFLKIFGFRSKNELERYKTVDFYSNSLERDRIEEKLASKGFLINEEAKLRKKDGSIFFASISSTSATDELGKVIHHDGIIEDITDRKAVEKNILDTQNRYHRVIRASNTGIWDWDIAINQVYFSAQWKAILGYKDDEIPNKFEEWEKLLHPNDKNRILKSLEDYLEDPIGNYETEFRLKHKDGSYRWIQNKAVVELNENSKPIRMTGSHLDITESKKDEELRNKLYETSRSLAESLDIDVVLNRMSKQARALLKCNGVTVYMVEDDKKTLKPVVAYDPPYTKQVLATKIRIDNSLTGQAIKAKKGKIFNYHDNIEGAFHIKGTPKTDTDNIIVSPLEIDGKAIGALTLVRSEVPFTDKDLSIVNAFAVYGSTAIKNANIHKALLHEINERKKTEVRLKESHDRYESIFNGTVDGIVYADWEGNIISVNSAAEKHLGIPRKKLIGNNAIKLVKSKMSGESLDRMLEFITNALKGDEIKDFLIKTSHTDFEFNTSLEKGKLGITVLIRDVTERNKARKNIELHQNNLATLSNELTMAEEKAKRHLAITLHDKLGQSLVLANFRSNELNKIVEKSEHKKIISEISGFLEDAINESRNITYELSPPVLYEMGLVPAINWKLDEIEKNNNIKTSLINRSKSYEIGKREQIILYRSINELLQNVLKHSKAGNVNVSFRLLTNDYRIIVRDNGIGFDLKTMRDKALSQKKFGLFSLMERIKYIGGNVEIDTKPGKGTKVIINMPI